MTTLSIGRRVAARLVSDDTPDGVLLSRFLTDRDEAAFAAVVRRHAGMVLGTCRRVLRNATDADDAFQAAFVVLVRRAHSLTDRACVGNFLYGVAFHTALKAKAMATKRRAREAGLKNPLPISTDPELTSLLDAELASLPDKYREPVVLCELEGVGRREAAERLQIPEGTISSRLATAHRMLEKRLRARGFAIAGGLAALAAGSQASAEVVTHAVDAALRGPTPPIHHLAAEVTKMLFLNKLKVGAAVFVGMLLLLAAGIGAVSRGTAADDKPAAKAPAPMKEEAKTDEDLLQGLWQAESLEIMGRRAPDEFVQKVQIRFKGADITFLPDDRTHTFELDTKAKPKAMNCTLGDGPDKGMKDEVAIYELDGDSLKLCMSMDGKGRPTEFKTGPKDNRQLLVLKRVKVKKDEPKANSPEKEAKKPDDSKRLQGTWVTTRVTFDPPMPAPPGAKQEFAQHILTFTDGDLTWASFTPSDPKTRSSQTKPFTLDQTASPKELTSGDNDCVYELDGDTLRVAMNFLTPGRPKGFNAKDSPPGKGHIWLIELKRVTDDEKTAPKAKPPEKKPEADKSYSLKDGEVLKFVRPPFTEERDSLFKRFWGTFKKDPQYYRMVAGLNESGLYSAWVAKGNEEGWPLSEVFEGIFGVHRVECLGDEAVLSLRIDADILVRQDTAELLLAALQQQLMATFGIDVTLEFKQMEREVVVASGTYTRRRRPPGVPEPRHRLDLFADQKLEKPSRTEFANTEKLMSDLASYVGRLVINKTDLRDVMIDFDVHEHDRTPATEETRAEDRDPAKVLKNLEDQTGLSFKLEKRKVRVLVVTKAAK